MFIYKLAETSSNKNINQLSTKLSLFLPYLKTLQIVGALWYLLAVERNDTCWQKYCKAPICRKDFLYCGNQGMEGYATWNQTGVDGIKSSCKPADDNDQFDFGIFKQALSSGIAASKSFIVKYCYCLWWGLQNLRYVLHYVN